MPLADTHAPERSCETADVQHERETAVNPLIAQFLRTIPPNEPVFVLRAQDELAARVVRDWAYRATEAGVNSEKVEGALTIAQAMDIWPTQKLPD